MVATTNTRGETVSERAQRLFDEGKVEGIGHGDGYSGDERDEGNEIDQRAVACERDVRERIGMINGTGMTKNLPTSAPVSPKGVIAERVLKTMGELRNHFPIAFKEAGKAWSNRLENNGLTRETMWEPLLLELLENPENAPRRVLHGEGPIEILIAGLNHAKLLVAHAGWRISKGVYVFDPTVFRELWKTPLSGTLPAEALNRLPEHCVYVAVNSPVKLPAIFKGLKGFFAYVDENAFGMGKQVTLVPDQATANKRLSLFPNSYNIPLQVGISVDEALSQTDQGVSLATLKAEGILDVTGYAKLLKQPYCSGYGEDERETVARMLSVLLYLCSEDYEIVAAGGVPGVPPTVPNIVRTKKRGATVMSAKQVTCWNVAWRLGQTIREAQAGWNPASSIMSGTRKRPHIRRAHWHLFWTGSRAPERADERLRVVKWIPPLLINADVGDDLPAVVRTVK